MTERDPILEVVDKLADTLAGVAGAGWLDAALAKPEGHPLRRHALVSRWRLCKRYKERAGRGIIGGPEDMVAPFVSMLLDAMQIQRLNEVMGQPNALLNRLAAVCRDSNQFSNTMAEISAAAWCLGKGFQVTLCTGDGMPEFSVRVAHDAPSLFIECKRPEGPITAEQLVQQLKRANRKVVDQPGSPLLLIIDLTDHVPVTSRDAVPPQAQACINTVEDHLGRQKFRNLAGVGFAWDQVGYSPPDAPWMGRHLRRHSRWLSHPHARLPVASPNPLDKYGFTVIAGMGDFRGQRNAACFCESGKRFKHCHGRLIPKAPS